MQIWLPDTRLAGFAEECARQARLVREAEAVEDEAQAGWPEEFSDTTGWTA